MIARQRAAAGVLLVAALTASAATAPPSAPPEAQASPAPAASVTRSTRFAQLGARSALSLNGNGATAALDFGSRSDELVTRALVRFRYAGSPMLAPGAAHIRLTLNGDAIGTLPFTAAEAGALSERSVAIDPRLLIGFNKLVMTLVTQPAAPAADVPAADAPADASARPGLWADVSPSSELELEVRPLALADDLAILPEPFFDRHDQRRVTVPFVFGAHPSNATLRASAVVASWLGDLASWRGARMPASLDAPASGHAIAFVANSERPAFLASLPMAAGPELRLMTNPADGHSKLLVLMGRDGNDLKAAADALVLGGASMSGASVQVKAVAEKAPPKPYEAPAWVPADRPAKLGDLIDSPQQLESSGPATRLEPVRVALRVPPDIAAWRGPGVPLSLKVQYTPAACVTDGYLDVSVNDELLETVPLRVARQAIIDTHEIFIPYYRLRSRMRLAFGFRFLGEDERCRDPARAPAMKAIVLPESTIDVSGFPHYVRMPNLAHFASIGFPFTRRADLGDTVVVLPDAITAADIETMLALMGRMGEATGRAATGVRVATARDAASLADADLLVIGSSWRQALLDQWGERIPMTLSGAMRHVSQPAMRLDGVYDWLGLAEPRDTSVASEVTYEGLGPTAAIYGFESPLTRGRSVVMITSVVPEQLARVVDALDDRDMRREVKGNAAFVRANDVASVFVGTPYYIGHFPVWTGLGYWLSQRPEMVGIALTVLLIGLGYAGFVVKNRIAAWRLRRRSR